MQLYSTFLEQLYAYNKKKRVNRENQPNSMEKVKPIVYGVLMMLCREIDLLKKKAPSIYYHM